MSTPQFNFTLRNPGNLLESSFLDLIVSNNSLFPPGTVLDAWCLDKSINFEADTAYTGYVYSAYEPPSISTILPNISSAVDKLDSVNWLLNYYDGKNAQYNWGEVQSAIWTLMGQDYRTELSYIQGGGVVLDADVTSLVNQALAQDGYRPGVGDSIIMIVDPVDANGNHAQPLVVEVEAASLGDRVWHDSDADGLQDTGEQGIAGAKLELVRDVNGDGVIGAGEVLAATTTNANGNYIFTGLTPGLQYQVRFTQPTGFDGISPRQVDGSSASGSNSDGALSDVVVPKAGENNETLDSGFYKTASIGDKVWNDIDRDGVQDANETGRLNVKVELYNCVTNALVATTTTDASGNYLFANLQPGTYHVKFYAPAGAQFSTVNVGDDALDSDANSSTGITGCYTVNSGDQITSVDAGLVLIPPTAADAAKVCEDRSTSFNVLTNDAAGLKLIGVTHESADLDSLFQSRGGAISFTSAGRVTYKTMNDHYGNDRLVYTVEDAAGNRTTQIVNVSVTAISDAPTAASGDTVRPSAEQYEKIYNVGSVKHWVYGIKLADFGAFGDKADELQQFGTYNTGAASDSDVAKSVVISGLKTTTAQTADLLFNGRVLDFSNGQTYPISVADINAGKLDIDMRQVSTKYVIAFQYIDTGTVANAACYDGSIQSEIRNTSVHSPTPIGLDLNGDGKIGVTGATASYQKDADAQLGRTVQFDINADGKLDTIEWFDGSGDGILIDNRDGNAALDMNGARLFGDQGGAYGNGYYKLVQLDANLDGQLTGAELSGLELWVDNGDAVVQTGEIQTLAQHSINAIGTQVALTYDAQGKLHIESTATRVDGSTLMSEDVFFAAAAPADLPALSQLLGHEGLDGLLGQVAPATAAANDVAGALDFGHASELLQRIVAALQPMAEAAAA